MVLSGRAIKKGMYDGIIRITPFSDDQIEAVHVNLHLGESDGARDGVVFVPAKGFVIAHTAERISLPVGICGFIEGRSKLTQQEISVEQSSKLVEPGSDNTMVLEIFNASEKGVRLLAGQKIAKMILLTATDKI